MEYNTPFKTELADKLKQKGIADSSLKIYLRNLEKLNDDNPLKNFNFLKSPEEVLKKLEKYKENTKRGFIISICSALSTDNKTKAKKKLYDEYFKIMIDMNKKFKEKESLNEKSETQKKNWVEWKEVESLYLDLKERVEKFSSAKEINEHNYNLLLSYVILSLYYFNPPRRNLDYQKMEVVKTEEPDLPIDTNYLDYEGKQFIFNVFKTSKSEGQQKIKISDELMEVINLYFKFHPLIKGKKIGKTPIQFLVYYNGNPLDKINSITRILNKIFGKSVGSSMLRHSFLSHKYEDTLKEQKSDALAMGHSLTTQHDYIKKSD